MAGQVRTKGQGAGGVTGSSRSSSPDRGQSSADDVKQRTSVDLLEALDELEGMASYQGPRCAVETLLASLDPEVSARVIRAIDETLPDGRWVPVSHIANLLTEFGYPNLYRSLARHRRRRSNAALGCRCP